MRQFIASKKKYKVHVVLSDICTHYICNMDMSQCLFTQAMVMNGSNTTQMQYKKNEQHNTPQCNTTKHNTTKHDVALTYPEILFVDPFVRRQYLGTSGCGERQCKDVVVTHK